MIKTSVLLNRRDFVLGTAAAGAAMVIPGVGSAAMKAINPKDLIIAFGHVGPKADEGWTWTHHLGRQAVAKAFPDAKILEVESIPFSAKGSRTIRQFVAQKADMVFLTTDYGDLADPIMKKNPEVAFVECAAYKTMANKRAYYVAHWDPSFLIGMSAGLMTKSNKLGYVGSYPTPAVQASINSFHLGARSVNPKVETSVIYINSWFNPQGASQAGRALVNNGSDFLFGIMDEAAYLQVAEEAGIHAAMWNTDIRKYGPNAYVSSVMLDWNDYYVGQVRALTEGKWSGGQLDILPMGGGVDRDKWGKSVPESVAKQVDATRDKMLKGHNPFVGEMKDNKGKVQIPAGQALTQAQLYAWPWLLEGIKASS